MFTCCVEPLDDEGGPGEDNEPITDLADLLKKELKYEKMRKEEAKQEEAEGEVRGGAGLRWVGVGLRGEGWG